MSLVTDFLARLGKVRQHSDGWTALCPAHDDKLASLSIGLGDDGRILAHCHAGCKPEDVVRAIGIPLADMFPPREESAKAQIIARYAYRDEAEQLLYEVVRFDPKDFRQRCPDGSGGWSWSLKGVRRVLYRLPELLAADPAEPVFVVEGEKDADALTGRGLVATTSVGGAGKWRPEYSKALGGRGVVVLPDNDKPGKEYAAQVAVALQGVARSVKVIELPGLPDKGDVSDWLAAGGDAATLERMAHEVAPSAGVDDFRPSCERLDGESERRLALAARVVPFGVGYLDDYCLGIHPTDLVVLCAATGAGKTTIAALIAQLAAARGKRVHFFALEAHKGEIEQRMLFREIADLARSRRERRITFQQWIYATEQYPEDLEKEALRRFRERALGMFTYYRGEKFTAEHIQTHFAAVREETDLVVLDHLHYVDSDDPSDNRAMKDITKTIRDAALAMERPVIVVAHLRKRDRNNPRLIPDAEDVHGSSDIVKIATKIVALAPARDRPSADPRVAATYVQVVKDRLVGMAGHAALCSYNLETLRYEETYSLGRLSAGGDAWVAIPEENRPHWAKHALCFGTPPVKENML